MIVGIEKIKGSEFSFPIAHAQNAIYKVESVNTLDKVGSSTGNWGAVILATFENKGTHYLVPQHVVFSIEYDTARCWNEDPKNTVKMDFPQFPSLNEVLTQAEIVNNFVSGPTK